MNNSESMTKIIKSYMKKHGCSPLEKRRIDLTLKHMNIIKLTALSEKLKKSRSQIIDELLEDVDQ